MIKGVYMNILFLGNDINPLIDWLKEQKENVLQTDDKISVDYIKVNSIDFIVSYGYRHIIKKDVIDTLTNKCINLHVSYLPFNRGADPNLWSFIEGTPKGVTIHYLDEGVDTGNIIVQKEVHFDIEKETLKSSYSVLQDEIQKLFKENWYTIKEGKCKSIVQPNEGTKHYVKDKNRIQDKLVKGWDTRVSSLVNLDLQ